MPLNYLDKTQMKDILTKTWQKENNTNLDPANGEHYEKNPDGSAGGLYGALDDSVDPEVHHDDAHKHFAHETIVCTTSQVDNRNGLTPHSSVTLTYTHSTTQTQTHQVSHTFHFGVGAEVKVKADFIVAEAEATFKFDFSYEYSFSNTNSTATTDTVTLSQNIDVQVPKGKVYKVVLSGTKQTVTVPTTHFVNVRGNSQTWYKSKVNGHYNWNLSAAQIFQKIKDDGTAGADSATYGSWGNDHGYIAMPGTLTGSKFINFQAHTEDITDSHGGHHIVKTYAIPHH